MGYTGEVSDKFIGGESEALRRLQSTVVARPQWVTSFQKPETSPNALDPSTTVLSPYLKFGCLSAAKFYYELDDIISKNKGATQPPVSLHGQLLWREFFYLQSAVTPNFDKMEGNPRCRQIPWGQDEELYDAFKNARTGYPYIDAIMTQLKREGWIHHLARHSLACFFTRGDLWQSWEKGAEIFDLYLLDSDWALNNANWQWLSCSNFFYQYFRCYSPIAFGKKTDKNGDYIRKYLPQLARYPAKFIYEPWKAPLSVQQECGCVIGDGPQCGYPSPIVNHDSASSANMAKMKAAYALHNASGGGDGDGDGDGEATGAAAAGGKRKAPSSSSSAASSSSSSSSSRKPRAAQDTPSVTGFFKKQPSTKKD
jgi:cryptochrome